MTENMERIRKAIQAHPEWSGRDIAGKLGLSVSYVSRMTREHPDWGYRQRSPAERRTYTDGQLAKLRELVQAHPDWPRRRYADAVGLPPHTVSALAHKGMLPGYQFDIRYISSGGRHNRRKKQKKNASMSIAACCAEAKKRGLTYGQYVTRMEEEDG